MSYRSSKTRKVEPPYKCETFKEFAELRAKGEAPIKYTPYIRYSPYKVSLIQWDKDRLVVNISVYVQNKGFRAISVKAENIALLIADLEKMKKAIEKLGVEIKGEEL